MTSPSRRGLLQGALGLSAVFLSAPTFAEAVSNRKLVVVVLRGALDGLSAVPPIGDADYAPLRGPIAIPAADALRLDGAFGLHPRLKALSDMAAAGEARIAPAAALPQRIRSHFEAQDLLESGGEGLYQVSTGWLNRALVAAGAAAPQAISIGPEEPLILRGPARTRSWSPGRAIGADQSRLVGLLQDLYRGDPLLGPALASGLGTQTEATSVGAGAAAGRMDARGFGVATARFLSDPGGPSIAVVSLTGFDTHANQGASEGQLAGRLASLDGLLEGLKSGLGPAWSKTVVVAATEFGRTARMNGTRGTDHGTASAVFLAGGALKRGGLIGDWPGLKTAQLFEGRDLAPTLDVRSVFKGVLAEHLGLSRRALDAEVFPGSAGAPPLAGLVSA